MNPLSELKNKADMLKTQIEAINVTSRNQSELLRKNVEIMEKQLIIMQGWTDAAVAQAAIQQRQVEILQEISDTLKGKKEK